MKRIFTIFIVVTTLILHSCGGVKKTAPVTKPLPTKPNTAVLPPVKDDYVVFTKKIYDQLVANGIDLKKVQYYNDQEIYLARGKDISDIRVEGGKIVEAAGNDVDKIVIPKLTPGRCELVEGDGLRVSFQNGATPFKFLNSKSYSPENFIFSGANWKDGQCDIDYNNIRYRASCGGGCISVADVKLVVQKNFLDKNNINTTVLKGVTVQ
jgi:hypothetical protein